MAEVGEASTGGDMAAGSGVFSSWSVMTLMMALLRDTSGGMTCASGGMACASASGMTCASASGMTTTTPKR